jgi:hypothetical protein
MQESEIERFRELVRAYHLLLERRVQERRLQHQRFLEFCTRGRALIEQRIKVLSTALQNWRSSFGAYIPTFDLFEVLGIDGKEHRYRDLITWLCRRKGGRGEFFARSLLSKMQPASLWLSDPVALQNVEPEFTTDDGRIDLVLEFEHFAIALEIKVWSTERDTPGEQPQTVSYQGALERALKRAGRSKSVLAVLLSPAGTPPLGTDAGRLSFFDLASAVLLTMDPSDTAEEQAILRLFAAHTLDIASSDITGRRFRELSQTLGLSRQAWPDWVIREANVLEKLVAAMEVHPR